MSENNEVLPFAYPRRVKRTPFTDLTNIDIQKYREQQQHDIIDAILRSSDSSSISIPESLVTPVKISVSKELPHMSPIKKHKRRTVQPIEVDYLL
jgi:hypothetical protein